MALPTRQRLVDALPDAPTARGALVAGVIGDKLYAVPAAHAAGRRRRRSRSTTSSGVAGRRARGCAARGSISPRRSAAARSTRLRGAPPRRATSRWSSAMSRPVDVASACRRCASRVAGSPGDRRRADRRRRRGGGGGHDRRGRVVAARTRRRRVEPRLPTPRHAAVSYRGRNVVLEGGPQPGLFSSDAAEALRVTGWHRTEGLSRAGRSHRGLSHDGAPTFRGSGSAASLSDPRGGVERLARLPARRSRI